MPPRAHGRERRLDHGQAPGRCRSGSSIAAGTPSWWGMGNFGAPPKPPCAASKSAAELAVGLVEQRSDEIPAAPAASGPGRASSSCDDPVGRAQDLVPSRLARLRR
ncbi:MAG: hypothetical protein MZV64_12735 [Ignavibacteriales bacterium]|nr:hypothetical protein [Ignavibacteriales bacterium]